MVRGSDVVVNREDKECTQIRYPYVQMAPYDAMAHEPPSVLSLHCVTPRQHQCNQAHDLNLGKYAYIPLSSPERHPYPLLATWLILSFCNQHIATQQPYECIPLAAFHLQSRWSKPTSLRIP